ncbi:MAG TPA: hypothetical protein VF190_06905 [Rhodothermales bacterium]
MEKTLNRSQLEAQLTGKSESIARRLEALQEEVGGISIRRMLQERPWISVGAAVVGGLLVGLLVGGRKSGGGSDRSAFRDSLLQGYVDAISEDVKKLTGRGVEINDAVARVLRDKIPVLVYASEPPSARTQGLMGLVAGLVIKQILNVAANAAIGLATAKDPEDAAPFGANGAPSDQS